MTTNEFIPLEFKRSLLQEEIFNRPLPQHPVYGPSVSKDKLADELHNWLNAQIDILNRLSGIAWEYKIFKQVTLLERVTKVQEVQWSESQKILIARIRQVIKAYNVGFARGEKGVVQFSKNTPLWLGSGLELDYQDGQVLVYVSSLKGWCRLDLDREVLDRWAGVGEVMLFRLKGSFYVNISTFDPTVRGLNQSLNMHWGK